MQAGNLDRKVQFLRATLDDDGFQSKPGRYRPFGVSTWASKRDVSDSERFAAGSITAGMMARFQVRYSSFTAGIRETDRLTCEGSTYGIVGIKEIGRREGLELTCQRIEHG